MVFGRAGERKTPWVKRSVTCRKVSRLWSMWTSRSFFDRVNHDILMDRLAKRIADKRILRLIRRYLQAGIMGDGVVVERSEGTPQGGRYPRSWPTCFWMKWTRNWNGEGTGSFGMPTIAISMFAVNVQENGCFIH